MMVKRVYSIFFNGKRLFSGSCRTSKVVYSSLYALLVELHLLDSDHVLSLVSSDPLDDDFVQCVLVCSSDSALPFVFI